MELEEGQLWAQQVIELAQAHQKIFLIEGDATKVPGGWFGYGVDSHHDRKTFKKFLQKQFGPYMVMKVFSDNNTYELAHFHGEKYGRMNHDKLKHFHTA